jgi:hypothetical protein
MLLFGCLALVVAGGCLSNTHRIPKGDLVVLAQVPPEQRGRRVRVIQGFAGDEGPPEAPAVRAGAVIVIAPSPGPGPVGRPSGAPARLQARESKAWIALAAIAALGLTFSEGIRYDGWVELHPMHPVHLYGPYGEYFWRPLAQIDPQTAAWASRAFVREGEGPWRPLGRAPLDRVGLTYSLLLGASELPSVDESERRGFMGHIQIGGFPIQELGILLDFGLAWGENELGATVSDTRNALELQLIPLRAGLVHAGGFVQGGFAQRLQDGPGGGGESDLLYGGGALLQIDLTTRLALTGRAGVAFVYDEQVTDFTVGLSVY